MINILHSFTQGTTTLDGITQSSMSPGVEAAALKGDGSLYGSTIEVKGAAPKASSTTHQVAKWLTHLGMMGKKISGDPLEMFFYAADPLGGRQATGKKISVASGMILPRTLSCSHGGDASLSADVLMLGVGTNAPFTITDGQALPEDVVYEPSYGLGTVSVNSSAVDRVGDVSIDFGIQEKIVNGDGEIYPTVAYIVEYAPTISFTCKAGDLATSLGSTGALQTVSVQLRKRDGLGYATTGHMTFSTHASHVTMDDIGGGHGDEASVKVQVLTAWDGSNHPITMS